VCVSLQSKHHNFSFFKDFFWGWLEHSERKLCRVLFNGGMGMRLRAFFAEKISPRERTLEDWGLLLLGSPRADVLTPYKSVPLAAPGELVSDGNSVSDCHKGLYLISGRMILFGGCLCRVVVFATGECTSQAGAATGPARHKKCGF